MSDLDIFFDTTVPAVKPTLLITNAYTLKKRMDEGFKKYGLKRVMDAYPHRDIDTIAAFKIATYDRNDPTYEMTGNEYFFASKIKIKVDKTALLNQIYLEIPRVSYQINPFAYFFNVWNIGAFLDVILDSENIGYGKTLHHKAKITDVSEESPNRRSCITLEIIKEDV